MKEIFKQAFENFQKVSDIQHSPFILNYHEQTYQDIEKAKAVNDEVNAYFDRVDSNYAEIMAYKQKGISRNKWFEEKLSSYEQTTPGMAIELVNAVQEQHSEHLKLYGVEEQVKAVNTPFSGVGKRIVSNIFEKSFSENTYLDLIQSDTTFDVISPNEQGDPATVRYFEEKLDSNYDKTFKKLGTAVVLRAQETGNFQILQDKSPTDIATTVDRVYTTAKVGYKIATGEMQASDATDYLIDLGVARVEAVIHHKAKEVGGFVGVNIGATMGVCFGPSGVAVGAAVGKIVGQMAGTYVAQQASKGIKKVASYAKEKVGAVANKVGSFISSATRRLTSFLRW